MIIYKITNKVNYKFYIGKTTKSASERFQIHIYNHKKGKTYLYKAMRKYGPENFIVESIESFSGNIDNENRESFWIIKLSPHYNLTKGGDGGDTSNSHNYKIGMKNRIHPHLPTYGMRGKAHPRKGISLTKNYCPVFCEGVEYASVGDAEKTYQEISVRKRLDNPNYPEFYRLREKIKRS